LKKKISKTPFTDWVKAGAKEEEWEHYLKQVEWKPKPRPLEDDELERLFKRYLKPQKLYWIY